MKQVRLFRRRFLPDEITELKDDVILSLSDDIILTKWNVLKPRKDIAYGVSAYFIKLGVKVSKVYNATHELVYWYCDIVEPDIDTDTQTYTFNDLLIDVLVYPDGRVEVVDMDEFADVVEKKIISPEISIAALRKTDNLLHLIYSGRFSELTQCIEQIEKKMDTQTKSDNSL